MSQQAKQIQSQIRQVVQQLQAPNGSSCCLFLTSIGNPEPKFSGTRHNAGHFMLKAVKSDLRKFGRPKEEKLAGGVGSLTLYDDLPGIVLLHSNTFMNTSGKSVNEAMKWFKKEYQMKYGGESLIQKFLVFHDDLDMELGDVKLKQASRASRGHNGLKSIAEVLQEDFTRLRVGIGRPDKSKSSDIISDFVLGKFRRDEEEILCYESVPQTLDYIDSIIKSGIIYKGK